MSKCKYCGRERRDDHLTCPGCGSASAAESKMPGCPITVDGELYVTCYECKNGLAVACPIVMKGVV